LLLVAVTNSSHHQRFMREKFFKNEITEKICQKLMTNETFTVEDWVTLISVAYLNGRHGTYHGRHFDWRVKNCLAKLKSLFTVSWTCILRPMHS